MMVSGQVRSGRSTVNWSEYFRYRWNGSGEGFWVFFMIWGFLFVQGRKQPTTNSATREAVELDLVAATKKEPPGEHGIRLSLRRGHPSRVAAHRTDTM